MIFGLQFLFWRELLPTGGIWKCFPCRRQIRKSGPLRLFWKLKLIKMFILAPVAKTRQGRKSSIHFYESVIIPTKLCVTCSESAPGSPHLLKHLPCMGAFSRTVLNANLRQQGSPPPPKEHGALCHLPLPIDSPLSEAQSVFLSADTKPGIQRADHTVSLYLRALSVLDFCIWGWGWLLEQIPHEYWGMQMTGLYFPGFILNDTHKDTQKRKGKRRTKNKVLEC